MRLGKLVNGGRSPDLPLTIELAGDSLTLRSLLRVLPGQRYVGAGIWQGKHVLAKLLVGDKAQRAYGQELSGALLLWEQRLRTPALLSHGWNSGEGAWLLFEFLDGSVSLWDDWCRLKDEPLLSPAQQQAFGAALALVAQMHRRGIWQNDLHLDNLLHYAGELYLVDGGGIHAEIPGQPLSRERVLQNLAVFFAQLPVELDEHVETLLPHYLAVNDEYSLPLELLLNLIKKVRHWRQRDYLRKAGRDCTLFSARRGAFGLRIVQRDQEAALLPLLQDLDGAIEQGFLHKPGGTATVASVERDGRHLLIKRYNIKGFWHWLKRFWRPSRAWHSWREGQRLTFIGIATPRPLAVVEQRWCGLRGSAYLLTEYCGGQDIITRFQPYQDSTPPEEDLQALDLLFAALRRERISHGDLKGHNVLWSDDGRWSLIDLDAMRQHRSDRAFARAYARDRARFLRNWPADSALYQVLEQRIAKTPGAQPTATSGEDSC